MLLLACFGPILAYFLVKKIISKKIAFAPLYTKFWLPRSNFFSKIQKCWPDIILF